MVECLCVGPQGPVGGQATPSAMSGVRRRVERSWAYRKWVEWLQTLLGLGEVRACREGGDVEATWPNG